MTLTFYPTIPNAPNDPADDQPLMQINNGSISTWVSRDHNEFNLGAGNPAGYHKVIHFQNQSGNPGVVAGFGQLFTKTVSGDQELFYESGNGDVSQLTANIIPTPGTNGYTYLPGGIILQWGLIVAAVPQTLTPVTFAGMGGITFPNNAFNAQSSNNATNASVNNLNISALTDTGFTYYNTSSNTRNYFWLAIGN